MGLKASFELRLGNFHLRQALSLEKGEVLALMGSSGSGKSLTLDVLAGLIEPDAGRIELDGKLLFDSEKKHFVKAELREVGYLFQGSALFETMSVIKNVMAASKLTSREDKLLEARESLRLFESEELADRQVSSLSGGERQRVALARLFVQKPKLLILDEPCSALDAPLRWQFECLLKKRLPGFSCPVIYVSHDRDEVLHLADKIQLIDEGKSFAERPRDDFFLDPINVSAAKMSGCKNILKARLDQAEAGVRLELEDLNYAFYLDKLELDSPLEQVCYVGMRAHDLKLAPQNEAACGLVLRDILAGPFVDFLVLSNRDESQLLVAAAPGTYRGCVGESFELCADSSRLYFFGEGKERVR